MAHILCYDASGQNVVDLAKPEFEGLWDTHKPYKVPKEVEVSPLKIAGASKMDKVNLHYWMIR